jgi:predicted RNA-binding Zn ribbon-like protein
METSRAPGELELVREFMNTLDAEDGSDELATSADLHAWLGEHGLPHGASTGRADLDRVRSVREALRSLVRANNGQSVRKEATVTIDRAARRAGLHLRFRFDGPRAETSATGVSAALGRLLAIVAAAMADGTWTRLKACRADDCQWVFYDHAKNRSRTWCSMAVCGNRAKARAYRSRRSRSPSAMRQRPKAPRLTSSAPR